MDITYEKIDKFSHDLVVGDHIEIGELHSRIEKVMTNDFDQIVLHLKIVGSTKKNAEMVLIISKKLPVTTLK